ncbi:hypothetical protein NA57DRAFT_79766 [Rhizodiscina lignyota]|uniref:Uncharacterized protein n=1 Tax=Rhizodiscina lignyota TaxID=1504668 RepID=A0A9P4M5G0_9PEZI|nr:hypothetical protein NA57DRAFT_79766 [Rhizodiscina lignyota]
MTTLSTILAVPDLLFSIADHLDLLTIISLLRTNKETSASIKRVEFHVCRIISKQYRETPQSSMDWAKEIDQTTIYGLSQLHYIQFATAVCTLIERVPQSPPSSGHLCDVSKYITPPPNMFDKGPSWKRYGALQHIIQAINLLRRMSRVASHIPRCVPHGNLPFWRTAPWSNTSSFSLTDIKRLYERFWQHFQRVDPGLASRTKCSANKIPRTFQSLSLETHNCSANESLTPCHICSTIRSHITLAARLAILRSARPPVLCAVYRIRHLLSVYLSRHLATGRYINSCSCGPATAPGSWIFNTVSPSKSRLYRSCRCSRTTASAGLGLDTVPLFPPASLLGRMMPPFTLSKRWDDGFCNCKGASLPHLPGRHEDCKAIAAQIPAPRSFNLMDPWTLWWFLDGEEIGRGVDLLWEAWHERDTSRPRATTTRNGLVSNTRFDWDEHLEQGAEHECGLYWRETDSATGGPLTENGIRKHLICALVVRCFEAWGAKSNVEKDAERALGLVLMKEIGLEAVERRQKEEEHYKKCLQFHAALEIYKKFAGTETILPQSEHQ